MLVIGLTGGIGSGKSTVARIFAELGVPIIDTDIIAKELTETGLPAYLAIVDAFGLGIIMDNGQLDRRRLRNLIFKDPNKKLWLEELLHPLIRQEVAERIKFLQSPYCIVVIPLLLESKPNPLIQRVLVVDTSEELQTLRVIARDSHTIDEIETIMSTQISRDKRLAAAQDIIYNTGKVEDLIPQVEQLHEFYLTLAQA
jgi:dephospho-CoA kinase